MDVLHSNGVFRSPAGEGSAPAVAEGRIESAGTPDSRIDAVFEGGGVKGIGLVGAMSVVEREGCVFENVAGTSAGAIVAALIAAGYRADELKEILNALDYKRFKDKGLLDMVPCLGPLLSLGFEKGIYEGRYFEEWIRALLVKKGIRTFGDLVMKDYADDIRYRYKLQVIAADISRGKMLVLPRDIRDYGRDPDALDVAFAVRMSMSIPFFFEPVRLTYPDANGVDQESYIVDGGVLSNYPVWLLDDQSANPPWPTIGFKLVEPTEERPNNIRGPLSMFAALFSTMMEAHDALYIKDADFARTIAIKTLGVQTTDFGLTKKKRTALYESGVEGAEDFFRTWNFEEYKAKYRRGEEADRGDRVRLEEPAVPAKAEAVTSGAPDPGGNN